MKKSPPSILFFILSIEKGKEKSSLIFSQNNWSIDRFYPKSLISISLKKLILKKKTFFEKIN